MAGSTSAEVWAHTCPPFPRACRRPWCRRYTRTSQPGVPKWFVCIQDSGTWSWSGQWDQYLWGEWHRLGLGGGGWGRADVGKPHNLVILLGIVMAGERRSLAVLTLSWRQKDSSSLTAMAGRSWREGRDDWGHRGVVGSVVCWGPWVMEVSADFMSMGKRGWRGSKW